jgi:hypothetical protein
MAWLSDDLREMGYMPTGEESPVSESGELWSNSHEIVCDETGIIIDGNHHKSIDEIEHETNCGKLVYRYENSERIKMPGGYLGSYDWGYDENDDEFVYSK